MKPRQQSCQSEGVQLEMKRPSLHPVLPVIFLFGQILHMNGNASNNFQQHVVWVLILLWTSVNEKAALGLPIFISMLPGYLL